MGEGRAEIFGGDRKLVSVGAAEARQQRGPTQRVRQSGEARGCSSVDGTLG